MTVVEIQIVLVFKRYYDGISVEMVEMIDVKCVVVDVVVVVITPSNHDSTSVDAPYGGSEL